MQLGTSSANHNIMMQDPINSPYNGENNLVPAEHQDHATDVASSCATSTKQPPVLYQDTGATKSINFISSSSTAHAPIAVSADVSQANTGSTSLNLSSLNILTHANLFTARPDQHVATAKAAPAAVPGDRGVSKINLSANISLNSCNDNNNSAANITNPDRADEHTNATTHAASGLTNPVTKKNSDKFGSSAGVRYKECLKNHAANMGGYAVDGCGEFMPSGERDSIEALKCAACGCHRNFHRREVNGGSIIAAATSNSMSLLALPSTIMNPSSTSTSTSEYGEGEHHNHTNSNMAGSDAGGSFPGGHYNAGHIGSILTHPHHHHHHQYMHAWMQGGRLMPNAGASAGQHAGILPVHYGGSQGPGSQYHYMGGAAGLGTGGISGHGAEGVSGVGPHLISTAGTSGKRFRTKFTMEQREKMFEFSEKMGWRIHKQDEAAVQQFCAESGVKRHVLKVWMHNNKNTFGKKLLRFPEAFNALPRSSA